MGALRDHCKDLGSYSERVVSPGRLLCRRTTGVNYVVQLWI